MKLFYKLMKTKPRYIIAMVLMVMLQQSGYSQLFQQNFTSSASVGAYVNATSPSTGQFNSILNTSGVLVSVNSNALQFSRSSSGSATFTRSTDLAGSPQTLIYEFDFDATGTITTANSAAVFKLGEGFMPNNNPEVNTATYGRIGVDFIAGDGWRLRNVVSGGTTPIYTTSKKVSWVLNRTATVKYYAVPAPGSGYDNVNSNTMDVFVDGVLVFNNIPVTTAGKQMTDLKFVINAGQNVTARITNMNINVAVGELTCPSPATILANTDLGECSGYVTVNTPVFTGPCSPDPMVDDMSLYIVNDYNGTENASDIYPVGITTVTYTATDKCGNIYTCTQDITVTDNEPAILTAGIINPSYPVTLGGCTYIIQGNEFDITATDNCYVDNYAYTISGATTGSGSDIAPISLAGAVLNKGINTITWTVTDGEGNIATQILTINVTDTQAPVIAGCPSDIIQPISCPGTVTWIPPTATDNCAGIITTSASRSDMLNLNDPFPVGTTTVKYVFTDVSGNADSCLFNVVIQQLSTIATSPDVNSYNIACTGASTGVINLTITNEAGTPSVSWTGPGGFTSNSQNLTGLVAGSYSYTVTDGSCTAGGSITLSEPAIALSGTVNSVTHVNCFGGNTGSISVSGLNGAGGYTYSIDGFNFQPSGTFTGLPGGTYAVTVSDINNCTYVISGITINQPGVTVTISASTNAPAAVGHGGSLNFTSVPNGGTAPYNFAWTGPAGIYASPGSTDQNPSFTNVTTDASGVWTVVVTDANGCTNSASTSAIVYGQQLYVNDTYSGSERWTTASGSNSNDGSFDEPLATIDFAYSVAQSGDIIHVDGGNYPLTSQLTINKNIEFRGANYDIPAMAVRNPESIIDITGIPGAAGCLTIGSSGATQILGFRIEDYLGGAVGLRSGIRFATTNGHSVSNNIIYRAATISSAGSDPRAIYITPSASGTLTIDNNHFYGVPVAFSSQQTWARGIWSDGGGVAVSITNNRFEQLRSMINIDSQLSAHTLSGNTFVMGGAPLNGNTAIAINSASASPYTIGANNFIMTPTEVGTIINLSSVPSGFYFDATASTLNGIAFPSLTLTDQFTLEAFIVHGTNSGKNGLVRTNPGNIYVIPATTNPAKGSIQRGINLSTAGETVNVANGTFNEDIDINKAITVDGESQLAIIRGLYAGSANTVFFSTSNSTLKDVTVTRDYGVTVTDWYNCPKNQGINIAQFSNGNKIDNVRLTGNRNAIYMNNAQTVTIQNCLIEDNRTGVHFTNICNGTVVKNNIIRNNFTHGVLFNYDTPPGLVPSNVSVTENSITGNWYAQVSFQHNNLSIPSTGSHAGLSFSCNWYGSAAPTATPTPAGEPGYVGQVPTQFGGTDPGLNRFLNGTEIALCPYSPWLTSGTDTDPVAPGFQPDLLSCTGTPVTVALTSQVNVTCNGGNDGSIDILVSGGTPSYTYLWSNSATTEDINSLSSGTYTVTVTDANGSTASLQVVITQPAVIAVSGTNVTDADCFGAGDGDVTITANGGTSPLSYTLTGTGSVSGYSSNNQTGTFTGLFAGTYNYSVTDINGCPAATGSVTVSEPAAITSSASTSDYNGYSVSCNGGNNGSATISFAGGTGPYDLTFNSNNITGVSSPQTISGLTAGTYSYSVTDSKGCPASSGSVTITEPAQLVATITPIPLSCNTGTTSATASATGGTGSYSYLWSDASTNATISGLTAGTYTVTVTDLNGCSDIETVTISNPVHTGNTWFVNDNSNSGDGYTTALGNNSNIGTASCPFATINFAISQAAAGDTIYVDAGTYTEYVSFNKHLHILGLDSVSTQIVAPTPSTGTVVLFSSASGASTSNRSRLEQVTVRGGQRGIDLGANNYITLNKVSVHSNSSYGVTLTNVDDLRITNSDLSYNGAVGFRMGTANNGNNILIDNCRFTSNATHGIYKDLAGGNPGGSFLNNLTVSNSVFTTNGISGSNGKAIYIEALNNGSINNNTFNGNGATATFPAGIDINLKYGSYNAISITDNLFTNNGVTNLTTGVGLTVKARNDAPSYSAIPASLSNLTVTGNTISGSPIGMSVGNDVDWATTTVENNSFNANGAGLVLYGSDPSSVMTVLNNSFTSNVQYDLVNSDASSSVIANCNWWDNNCSAVFGTKILGAVTYTSWLADGNDNNGAAAGFYPTAACSSTNINIPAVLTHVSCNGYTNGAIDITPSGGSGSYSYSWSTGATTEDISGLAAGTYTVTVSDGVCSATATFTITEPAVLSASASVTSNYNGAETSCFNSADGSATVTQSGGTSPYTYAWSSGSTNASASGLAAGTYTVTVTDVNGCSTSTTVTITSPPPVTASISPVSPVCEGNTISIDLTASGGTSTLTYSWSGPASYNSTTEDVSISSVTAANEGTYTVVVTDVNGCTATASVSVDIQVAPVITTCPSQAPVSNEAGTCEATVIYPAAIATGDPAPAITYSHDSGTSFPVGTTVVTVTASNGCASTTCNFNVVVNDTEAPSIVCAANVTVNNTTGLCTGTATLTPPTVSDNCSAENLINVTSVRSDAQPMGSPYPVGTTTVTWTATDESLNSATCTQTVTVLDAQVPVLAGCFSQIIKEAHTDSCGATVFYVPPTASDNCNLTTTVTPSGALSGTLFPVGTTVVTYTFSDGTNSVNCTFNVIVNDTSAPVASCKPATIYLDANGNATLTVADINNGSGDECSFTTTLSDNSFTCADLGPNTVTLTVTDASNNISACTATVTVVDSIAPVLAGIPSNIAASCDNIPAVATGITASDNCNLAPVITFNQTSTQTGTGCGQFNYIITRTWTANDGNGNSSSASQIITVTDQTAPVLSGVPADANASCDNIPAPAGGVSALDNCDTAPTVTMVETDTKGLTGCSQFNYTITRTWTATDACGNSSSASQIITVTDQTAPVLSGVPADANASCDNIPTPASVTASDNCDTAPTVTMVETDTKGLTGCSQFNYTITRTWTATDACGNSSSDSQIITVTDQVAPVLSGVPADANASCDNIPTPASVTASDNCDTAPTVTMVETDTKGLTGCSQFNYTITRTWTATDACGNSSSDSQIITVTDQVAPVLSGVPADANASCDNIPNPASVTASDNCDIAPTVTMVETDTKGLTGCSQFNYTITRTWTATDACGNSSSDSQVITVTDQTAPVLSGVPAAANASCDNIPTPASVTASDNCDTAPTVTMVETDTKGLTGCSQFNYTITRTWTATDACGNSSSESQIITVTDQVAPVLSGVPAAANASCDNIPVPAGGVSALDNCDTAPTVTMVETDTKGLTGCSQFNYTITRTWTATDACGNSSSDSQIITVTDQVAPVLSGVPADANASCDNIPAPAVGVSALDNCDTAPTVTMVETDTKGLTGCSQFNYTITRTWTATDACGNSSSDSQIITVTDQTAPVLSGVPADANASCDNIPTPASVTASDNCDTAPTVTMVETDTKGLTGCSQFNYTITRTWTATDACGNSSSDSQIITVTDQNAPVLSGVPADANASCDNIPNPASVTASDNCDSAPTVTMVETDTKGLTGCSQFNYTITRTWTATDACGNSSSDSQIITVTDQVAPVLSGVPADANASCDNIPVPTGGVSALDNCDTAPTVTMVETDTKGLTGCSQFNYTITRTWTATDACGNSSSDSQIITVTDQVAPVLSGVPADANASCDNIPAPASVTASDNCDSAPVVTLNTTSTQTVSGCTQYNYTITRTWTATDACGNSVSASQVITVSDQTPPVAIAQNVTVNLDANGNATVSATVVNNGSSDNCSDIMLSLDQTSFDCSDLGANTVTLTVTDACGNSSTATATVTVADNLAPSVSCPATQTQYIGGSCNTGLNNFTSLASYSDNCIGGVTLSQSPAAGSAISGGTTSVTITATDASGNSTSCTFNVNVMEISLSTVVTNVSCNGASTGSVNLTVNNAAPGPVTYNWSNGAVTEDLTGVAAGTYTVTVTNGGCTFTTSATVTQPAVLFANATKTNVVCNGANNGTATANPSGGTSPYTYLWSNGSTNQSIGPLAPANYTVTVTDANGCTAVQTVTVTQPAGMILATSKTNVTCPGGTNGTANVAVSGGVSPYTYLWSNGATTANITGIAAGIYTVTVTDNGGTGCSKTATVIISQPAAWNVSFTNVPGTLTVNASGATPGYTYKWSTGAVTQSISTVTGNTYTVTVTDSRGCKFISSPQTAARLADLNSGEFTVSAWPNPTNGILYLEFTAEETDIVSVTMHDLSGRLMFAEDHSGISGLHRKEYHLDDFADGMYLLTLNNGDTKQVIRIVVEK